MHARPPPASSRVPLVLHPARDLCIQRLGLGSRLWGDPACMHQRLGLDIPHQWEEQAPHLPPILHPVQHVSIQRLGLERIPRARLCTYQKSLGTKTSY